jgi:hypothetical protein
VSILNSEEDPIAAYSVLFKKGYDLGFMVPGCIYSSRMRLRYHPVTKVYGTLSGSASAVSGSKFGSAGCSGDDDAGHFDGLYNMKAHWANQDHPTAFSGAPQNVGAKAYGFAYGILNVRPQQSKAVFRSDRWGQFRDMLEQRRYGKFFKPASSERMGNRMYSRGRKNIQSRTVITDGPVQCTFVDSDDGRTIVSPYATDSFNMDNECTSSYPYADGKIITGSNFAVTEIIVAEFTSMTRAY